MFSQPGGQDHPGDKRQIGAFQDNFWEINQLFLLNESMLSVFFNSFSVLLYEMQNDFL